MSLRAFPSIIFAELSAETSADDLPQDDRFTIRRRSIVIKSEVRHRHLGVLNE